MSAPRPKGVPLHRHKGWSGPAVLDVSHVVERAARAGGRRTSGWPSPPHGVGREASLRRRFRRAALFLPEQVIDPRPSDPADPRDEWLPGRPSPRLTREARRGVVSALTEFPVPATGHRGLPDRRGDRRRRVSRGGRSPAAVRAGSCRPLLRRGDSRRLRPDRRLQFPVGLGDRADGGRGCGAAPHPLTRKPR